jgi:hypothetical protein
VRSKGIARPGAGLPLLLAWLAVVPVCLAADPPRPAPQAIAAQLPPIPFKVGEPFPAIPLPAADDGRKVSIADFRGQRLIVHVFASW